jgi:hypothetical protein
LPLQNGNSVCQRHFEELDLEFGFEQVLNLVMWQFDHIMYTYIGLDIGIGVGDVGGDWRS